MLSLLVSLALVAQTADPGWVSAKHAVNLNGSELAYTSQAGFMPLKNAKGETDADVFFVSYAQDGVPKAKRPVTFCWNGGPGSSSIWLHMGCMAPRRVHVNSDGSMARPPYHVEDNSNSWLPFTDLVFVDPVGTGYSKGEKTEASKYWGVDADINSIGEFIRLYLTRTDRWSSPVFLAGESYGTFRAAGLSEWLQDHGIGLNGIVLMSSAVNFNILITGEGNDVPFMVYLPSYTAIAAFHKKLSPEMNADPSKAITECESFASGEYWSALAKGDKLNAAERQSIASKLSKYTGLSQEYCLLSGLRIYPDAFQKELLRHEGYTIGRLDARVKGTDFIGITMRTDYDPAESSMDPSFVSTFNDYIRNEVGFKTDQFYNPLNLEANGKWDWGPPLGGYPSEMGTLRSALAKNENLRILDCQGIYDLATAFYGSTFTLQHLGLPDRLKDHIQFRYYKGGHMMYLNREEGAKLRDDVGHFIQSCIG